MILAVISACCLLSCKDNEEQLFYFSVDYKLQIPAPITAIADAYVTYTSNGVTTTEPITDGKYRKLFEYRWKDDQVEKAHTDFNSVRVHFNLKVDPNSLPESMELLNDNQTSFVVTSAWRNSHDKDNVWTGSSASTSTHGGDTYSYTFAKELRERSLSKAEVIEFLKSPDPIFSYSWDYYNTNVSYSAGLLKGLPESAK